MNNQHNRVFIIDLYRGSAAFFLVSVHTLWMYASKEVQFDSVFGSIVHTAGQATAAFLITMGFSFVVTRHQSFAYAMKRAVLVLLAGYMLNALKFIVPIKVFGTMPESFINAYGWESPLSFGQLRYLLLTGDILQLAGISFIIAGLVRQFVSNKYVVLSLAFLSIAFYMLVKGYRPGIAGLDYLCDLLWGDQWNVYFPVFPWISNILVGMFLGMCYRDYDLSESRLLRYFGWVGVPCFVIGAALCAMDWKYHFNDFFHPGPGGALIAMGASMCFGLLYYALTKPLQKNTRFRRAIAYLSARVTSIYIIQWTLVCWGMGVFGYHALSTWQVLALIPVMTALTLVVDYIIFRAVKTMSSPSPVSVVAS